MDVAERAEYPRPRLTRPRWASLNGPWAFGFDDADRGLREGWHHVSGADLDGGANALPLTINVPFCFQSELSGIGDRDRHDVVWYGRTFDAPTLGDDETLLLHFGAVDYRSSVWVNGARVAQHEGGHTPFFADIGAVIRPTGNVIVVRAEDPLDDLEMPRGKQYWVEKPALEESSIFYTPTTGIWQSVWLEPVGRRRIADVELEPDLDAAEVLCQVTLVGDMRAASVRITISLEGHTLADDHVGVVSSVVEQRCSVLASPEVVGPRVADAQGLATWSPEDPKLYDVAVQLFDEDGQLLDAVETYVGMRKIEIRDGRVLLNGRPYQQRLVLDQGYFPGGLLTAASDDALRADIEAAKELGFNGARKHQKVEDPRWLHWADRLGFLVWSEMPSAYRYSSEMVRRVTSEWEEVVRRDRSHPCIVAWVPMNESWGVPRLASDVRQRELLLALYHLTRSLDPTRPVVSNDGWEHATTDLCTIHDYGDASTLRTRYATRAGALAAEPADRPIYLDGYGDHGAPMILSEFGGVAIADGPETWGYDTVTDTSQLAERVAELVAAADASPALQGFCYTQLTDVEQEANGLLTFDRRHKVRPDVVRRVIEGQQGS